MQKPRAAAAAAAPLKRSNPALSRPVVTTAAMSWGPWDATDVGVRRDSRRDAGEGPAHDPDVGVVRGGRR